MSCFLKLLRKFILTKRFIRAPVATAVTLVGQIFICIFTYVSVLQTGSSPVSDDALFRFMTVYATFKVLSKSHI